jgi:hypothetical protein
MSPFKSKSQQKFMYATDPAMAEEFQKKTKKGAKLPPKVKPKKKKVAKGK